MQVEEVLRLFHDIPATEQQMALTAAGMAFGVCSADSRMFFVDSCTLEPQSSPPLMKWKQLLVYPFRCTISNGETLFELSIGPSLGPEFMTAVIIIRPPRDAGAPCFPKSFALTTNLFCPSSETALKESFSRFLKSVTCEASAVLSSSICTFQPERTRAPSSEAGDRSAPTAQFHPSVPQMAFPRYGDSDIVPPQPGFFGGLQPRGGLVLGPNNPIFSSGADSFTNLRPNRSSDPTFGLARFDPLVPRVGPPTFAPLNANPAPLLPGEPNADHLRPLNNDLQQPPPSNGRGRPWPSQPGGFNYL